MILTLGGTTVVEERVIIDLDRHRSPGVGVFIGEDRAKAISDSYPEGPTTIRVPEDVISFTNGFVREFHRLRPNLLWEVPRESFRARVEELTSRYSGKTTSCLVPLP